MSQKPYVIVNFAMSADGKLSTIERRQVKISGKNDFSRVDELKSGVDAIMVGIGTVLADNPSLTIKSEERINQRLLDGKPEHPIRIVVDSMARTPLDAKILNKGSGKRIIGVSNNASPEKIKELSNKAIVIVTGEKNVDLKDFFSKLYDAKIYRLMVEGGGTLIAALFKENLVDELSMFIGNIIIGGKDAPTPADGVGNVLENDFTKLDLISIDQMDEGVLIRWKVREKILI